MNNTDAGAWKTDDAAREHTVYLRGMFRAAQIVEETIEPCGISECGHGQCHNVRIICEAIRREAVSMKPRQAGKE